MPREIFALGSADLRLSYKAEYIIHLGMCVKETEGEWEQCFRTRYRKLERENVSPVLKHAENLLPYAPASLLLPRSPQYISGNTPTSH
jgi:hypothetical protein